MSTYALTMYRHVAKIEGKQYKIGEQSACVIAYFDNDFCVRSMGHCRIRVILDSAWIVLLPGECVYPGVRYYEEDHLHELEEVVL